MKIVNGFPSDVKKGQFVALDVETFGQEKLSLHRPTGTFACLSVMIEGDKNTYQIYDSKDIKKMLSAVSVGTWVFHNCLYDLRQLMRFANIKPRFIWDIMLVEQSMFGGLYIKYSLKDMVRRWLQIQMDKEVRDEFSTATEMTKEMKQYAAKDANYTLQIAIKQRELYDGPLLNPYKNIDEPCIWPILDMPGIRVNTEGWRSLVEGFQEKVDQLQGDLGINVMSGAQVKAAVKKIAHVQLANTQADTLNEFKDIEFVAKILEARMYRKAVSTYGLKWIERYVESDGKVYASYHINGAETGRFSCSDPNMMQIPARRMPQYRTLFIASPNSYILVSDISQQEPRILAHESKDKHLLDAFNQKEDLHLYVARSIFNDQKMTKDDPRRFVGKTINLGTSYGLTEYGLSRRLGISEDEAGGFLRQYFARFSGVFSWIALQRQAAFEQEYVKTVSGRRVWLNLYDRQWENNAINAPIQGGAADFTKMWIRNYWKNCNDRGLPYVLVANVHDELVLDVPASIYKQEKSALLDAFNETAEFLFPDIPFVEDTERGHTWACKQMPEDVNDEDE